MCASVRKTLLIVFSFSIREQKNSKHCFKIFLAAFHSTYFILDAAFALSLTGRESLQLQIPSHQLKFNFVGCASLDII